MTRADRLAVERHLLEGGRLLQRPNGTLMARLRRGLREVEIDVRRTFLLALLQERRCAWCGCHVAGTPAQGVERHTVDHVVPLARGGTDDLWNIVLACGACGAPERDRYPTRDEIERHARLLRRLTAIVQPAVAA